MFDEKAAASSLRKTVTLSISKRQTAPSIRITIPKLSESHYPGIEIRFARTTSVPTGNVIGSLDFVKNASPL
jgi:hypothetical protein